MRIFLFALFFAATQGQASNPHKRSFEDFQGNRLVIGCGNYSYYASQKTIRKSQEYSIDINRRVYPCMQADGLEASTYRDMPDQCLECITFEHISFAPYSRPETIGLSGGYKSISSGAYEPAAWEQSIANSISLPRQMLRLLKPAGRLVFKTCVLGNGNDFTGMHLDPNAAELPAGLVAWHSLYKEAGFKDIHFTAVYHENLSGWYIQMSAVSPTSKRLTRSKAANDEELRQLINMDR